MGQEGGCEEGYRGDVYGECSIVCGTEIGQGRWDAGYAGVVDEDYIHQVSILEVM